MIDNYKIVLWKYGCYDISMIAELFDDISVNVRKGYKDPCEPALMLEALAPIFDKMGLPLPEDGIDISRTLEHGYNLMLNRYGAVLRIYPSLKEGGDEILTHRYHPDIEPPIGRVQFKDFALQLMPAREHREFSVEEIKRVSARIKRDSQGCDSSPLNYGGKDEPVLIDTVGLPDFSAYLEYHKKGILDEMLKRNEKYEELQNSFYSAWIGEKSFDDFWKEMEAAKKDGLLDDGWNNSPHNLDFRFKGNIVELAAAYENKLKAYHEEERPEAAVSSMEQVVLA